MAIQDVTDICDNSSSLQPILQLFDDKCFKVVEGSKTTGQFCLGDFAFPTDGYSCVSLSAESLNGEITLFDNEILTAGSPVVDLLEGKLFVRGILLSIEYPSKDTNGEDIDIVDKNVELWIEDAETLQYKKHPLHNFFSIFTNPKSNDPRDLINRIKIVNPNTLFSVKVKGLIVYGKVQ